MVASTCMQFRVTFDNTFVGKRCQNVFKPVVHDEIIYLGPNLSNFFAQLVVFRSRTCGEGVSTTV